MGFRKGDVVELLGVVRWDQDPLDNERVYITVGGTGVYINVGELVLRHPGFEIGDEVVYEPKVGTPYSSKVVAIHKEQAWIEGEYDGIVDMYELTRPRADVAEAVEVAPEAPPPAPELTDDMPF